MAFLVTLIALLTERFFHWGHLRQWKWLDYYFSRAESLRGKALQPAVSILLLLPPVILVAIVQWILDGRLHHLPALLFDTAVVLYAMGPDNFWETFYAGRFHSSEGEAAGVDTGLFVAVYDGVFGVLFWFWILGPAGAVLYRVVVQAGMRTGSFSEGAVMARNWLDWIPVRLFSFLFAFAGQFAPAFACWRKHALEKPSVSTPLLAECGRAALGTTGAASGEEALSLLDRVLIIMLVILALVVLALQ